VSQLRQLQQTFFAALPPTASQAHRERSVGVVRGSARHSAVGRLGIYHRGYLCRLTEALQTDFEQLRRGVGDKVFAQLCSGYLTAHPSRTYSLHRLGAHFVQFLRTQSLPRPDFTDLAALEWARVQAIHRASLPPCTFAAWQARGPELAPHSIFLMNPSLKVLRTPYAVEGLWHALEHGKTLRAPHCAPSRTAVWREGRMVAHRSLAPREARALFAARRGCTFVALCGLYATAPEPAQCVITALQQWFAAGFIVGFKP
jgi:hypothetical protein